VDIAHWAAARDVQARLGYSGPHVNRLVRQGKLRAVRTRIGWLIDPQSVEAFAAARDAQRKQHETEAVPA
jgi:excisionase family DNA binding protein